VGEGWGIILVLLIFTIFRPTSFHGKMVPFIPQIGTVIVCSIHKHIFIMFSQNWWERCRGGGGEEGEGGGGVTIGDLYNIVYARAGK
jgi:hypothetical protein